MEKQFQIRVAVPEDAQALATISGESLDLAWNTKDFLDAISSQQAGVYVAEDDVGLCGYVVLYHAADEGEVPSVAVSARARKCGIANGMMKEAFSYAATQGVKKVFLEVRESNTAARALYDGLGFLQVSVRKNFYTNPTEDACLLMCLIG